MGIKASAWHVAQVINVLWSVWKELAPWLGLFWILVAASTAEAWDGTRWTLQATPKPTDNLTLNAVSCTSATACTAVGSSNDISFAGPDVALVERYW